MAGRSALAEVMAASARYRALGEEMRQMETAMGEPMEPRNWTPFWTATATLVEEFEHRGGYDLESRAQAVLTGLGIGPDDYLRPVESFTGGWKMRIGLARILTINPDVLLLDEPTNHLDLESIVWLENWLANEFKGALLMTCHDRDFMNRLVSRIVEVANQAVTTYNGNYDFYLREREIRREQLLASHRRQQEMLAKEEEFIARFAARASHAAQVQSRVKKIEKIERIELPPEQQASQFRIRRTAPERRRRGPLEDLGKVWPRPDGGEKSVFGGVSGMIRRQEKIAVVGVNGAGKSSFPEGAGRPDRTQRRQRHPGRQRHPRVISASTPWSCCNPKLTVFETVQGVLPQANIGVITQPVAAFLFPGDEVEKRIASLSGGEKSRLVLATLLARPLNFLDSGRAHQPSRYPVPGNPARRPAEIHRHRGPGQPRPPLPARPGQPGLRDRPWRDADL